MKDKGKRGKWGGERRRKEGGKTELRKWMWCPSQLAAWFCKHSYELLLLHYALLQGERYVTPTTSSSLIPSTLTSCSTSSALSPAPVERQEGEATRGNGFTSISVERSSSSFFYRLQIIPTHPASLAALQIACLATEEFDLLLRLFPSPSLLLGSSSLSSMPSSPDSCRLSLSSSCCSAILWGWVRVRLGVKGYEWTPNTSPTWCARNCL